MADGTLGAMTVARHDPLGYDIRAELFGSRDSVSVGLGPHTPMRSVEPGVPPPAGPAWADFVVRFEQAYRDELVAFLEVARGDAAESLHRRRRIGRAAGCGGRYSVAPRASTGPRGGDRRVTGWDV